VVIRRLVEQPVVDAGRDLLARAIVLHEGETDVVLRAWHVFLDHPTGAHTIHVAAQRDGLDLRRGDASLPKILPQALMRGRIIEHVPVVGRGSPVRIRYREDLVRSFKPNPGMEHLNRRPGHAVPDCRRALLVDHDVAGLTITIVAGRRRSGGLTCNVDGVAGWYVSLRFDRIHREELGGFPACQFKQMVGCFNRRRRIDVGFIPHTTTEEHHPGQQRSYYQETL